MVRHESGCYSTVRGGFGQELRQISPSVNLDFFFRNVRTYDVSDTGIWKIKRICAYDRDFRAAAGVLVR